MLGVNCVVQPLALRGVGREFTALGLTAPLDTSHWSASPHHADRGRERVEEVFKHNDSRTERQMEMGRVGERCLPWPV